MNAAADFTRRLQAAQEWAQEGVGQGWLDAEQGAELTHLQDRSPSSLFDPATQRPLVVALYGGTGVGKSSLLNRLAGQAIARVGVERPTSRELSIYLHESIAIQPLRDSLPVDRVRMARHGNARMQSVLWVDMPDVDSTEIANGELVREWLPHADVLVYVVSPERYRDHKAWLTLAQQGHRHAWLFVLNQWDRSCAEQREDFLRLLRESGFADPLLWCTDCREEGALPDEFAQLQQTLEELSNQHVLGELESRGHALRNAELEQTLETLLRAQGSEADWQRLAARREEIWRENQQLLLQGMQWAMQLAARETAQGAGVLGKGAEQLVWDDWAQTRLQDLLDRIHIDLAERWPALPLQHSLEELLGEAPRCISRHTQLTLRLALARPGNGAQRWLLRCAGLCQWLLPLAVATWVAWQASSAYYASMASHSGYLGVDFLAHSALLLALSWLLPFFLRRQWQPSVERVALQGLQQGLHKGLAELRTEMDGKLDRLHGQWRDWMARGAKLRQPNAIADSAPTGQNPTLNRMLQRPAENSPTLEARVSGNLGGNAF